MLVDWESCKWTGAMQVDRDRAGGLGAVQPVNQGRHYQKEMNPPSPSNTRDWLNMLSPPIVPPSQQPAEQLLESSASVSVQGEEDLSAEEDEEVLTLLYDPCLNCYFDPQTGKYYELV
ncbi:hypothetical protein STEG23_002528 [Scotinomys teguina]